MQVPDAPGPGTGPGTARLLSVLSQDKIDRCPVFGLPLQVPEAQVSGAPACLCLRVSTPCPGHAPRLSPGLPQDLPVSVPRTSLPDMDTRHLDRHSQAVKPGILNGLAQTQTSGTGASQASEDQSPLPLSQVRTTPSSKETSKQNLLHPVQEPALTAWCRTRPESRTYVTLE
jgi:hypothetical protein